MMTYAEFAQRIEQLANSLDCRYAYHHFPLGKIPKLPWIVFDYPSSRNIFADNENYKERTSFVIDFYCESKDFETEAAIEEALKSFGLSFEKYEDWIDEENFYKISYEGEFIVNG